MTLPHTVAPIPAYGAASLADVLPAIAAGFGLTGADGVPATGLVLPAGCRKSRTAFDPDAGGGLRAETCGTVHVAPGAGRACKELCGSG
jgi:hypothetical protein